MTVTTLADFRRVDSGRWEGPVCDFPPNPGLSAPISLTWGVGFDDAAQSAEEAARSQLTFEWTTVESGPIAVPHLVGGAQVGTIPGFFVLTDARSQVGYHESALAFPLGRGVYAAVEFWSRGNGLECTVRGVPVATWHRQTARAAVQQIRLEGNLPPGRVTARASAGRLRGAVTDSFAHPDVGIAVRLEKRVARRWRPVRSGRTAAAGAYSLRTSGPGTYRVVATVAGVSVRSAAIRAR